MKMNTLGFAVCALFAGMSGSAMAATYTFGAVTTSGLGNTQTFAATSTTQGEVAPGVKVSAWASTTSSVSSDVRQAYLESSGSQSLRVRSQGETTDSPDHALDNNGTFEALLFDFGSGFKADLDTVKLSWSDNDSDLTIFAYTAGAGAYTAEAQFGTGVAFPELLGTGGWALVGNYSNMASSSYSSKEVNGTNIQSRYWLIGARGLADGVVGTNDGRWGGTGAKFDYVKLAALGATVSKTPPPEVVGVPEPESIALMGAALAGMVFIRRRRQA